jgi:hypothetical protein
MAILGVLKKHCQLTIMAACAIHQTSELIKHYAETEATGSATFAILASVSQTMENSGRTAGGLAVFQIAEAAAA